MSSSLPYTHRYSLTAAAICSLAIQWQKETFLGDTLLCRLRQLPSETEETYNRYLHTITRGDGQTVAQIYSEWTPRTVQVDASELAPRV